MKKPLKWLWVGTGAALLIAVVGTVTLKQNSLVASSIASSANAAPGVSSVAVAPQTGYRMPPFKLQEYPDNQTIDTEKQIGKPIFINFWTSWCIYCKLETPYIVQAYKQYGDKVVFLSVNVTAQDSMADMEQFVKQYGITWPVALDTKGTVTNEYGVIGLPTSFFVNRQGVIVATNVGAISKENLMAELERISK
ncbi:TlpA family protein disulfide reductase [Alicyclobacillus acidocaldarius]|uniref:Alkyl hydroperoxide reductase/ Thiol specific antioxidant/ Mal allergen n=1 Tax=Alicyclobacillus acidocaldarius subsp. acidocaldarius (strain ATCC 27009 / DSM 446 / BCRC 14685 / JCM 5260 / KCTC 1825 / NBRC 15652 / NCIMB 11725 / NRRL B-14509 / 104-IA) TaxID=521098 RepID=C8WVM2_ALIAD|nr:TlpA disulfide reductase family protein [Alicyclobacillus acidocaldarius]ACV58144.1 alkyl hydroperoxide reductase/ Thiol specific antioxidant/ Mal allergen [Alicyclobacillus acidocaldarius subsp. acidocaldarius DSM 446]